MKKSECVTAIATAIALELACGRSVEEIMLIKNIANQIVTTLGTIASTAILDKIEQEKGG